MEFKNGYNFLYQKARDIYASKIGRPGLNDDQVDLGITPEELENVKLVYETTDSLVVSFKNIPTTNDIPIELTANGEEVIGPSAGEARVLVPFELGMSIRGYDFGNVKNGDINLELDQYLLSLPERETLILVGSENDGAALFAVNYQGQAFIYTFLGGGSGEPTLYYSTVEGDIGEFYAKRGYQNLDDTGRVYSTSYTVDLLNQGIEDDSWNGKFIGAIVDSRPTRLIPLKKGDKFVNIHFDTTLIPTYADFYLSRQADHVYVGTAGTWNWYYGSNTKQDVFACWYYEAGAKVDTPSGQITLEKPMFLITAINSTLAFYADENAVEYLKLFGVNTSPGWQGSTLKEVAQKFDVSEYLVPDAYGELVNNILGPDYTGAWNGRFIGFTEDDYYVAPEDDETGSSSNSDDPGLGESI